MSNATIETRATTALRGLLASPTSFLFFTGKGGVGKTSTASATAVALADAGRRVLIVSTDPASNLREVLGVEAVATAAVGVAGVPGLDMLDLDPTAAAETYRETVVAPYRGVLPPDVVAQIEEELAGPCTVEVAAFNEFVSLLTRPDVLDAYDHVLFDTAPTGHTLRLLSLPAAWDGFLTTTTTGITCVGPVSSLGQARAAYASGLAALRDGTRTTVVLVARPERPAIEEAARAAHELAALGMTHQRLVLNGVLGDPGDDPVAVARHAREADSLSDLPRSLESVRSIDVQPLLTRAPLGIDGLRAALGPIAEAPEALTARGAASTDFRSLAELVESAAAAGPGIVMTMGKGGVGKTTVAAAVAVGLAARGLPVTLTTTDPAAHVDDVLVDPPPNLRVTRIDPGAVTAAYQDRVLTASRDRLDDAGLDLLAEDLRSPCTEEVAVFHAFAETIAEAENRWVVVDTAPTGHTLLLLQSAQAFGAQSSVTRPGGAAVGDAAVRLQGRLADPDHTRIVLVTLPEAVPVHEATALQQDLQRAGLHPWAWVVNATLAASGTHHPVLRGRADAEHRWIEVAVHSSARPPAVLPWLPKPPVSVEGLSVLLT